MLRRVWAGSIHGRLFSVDEASSFFEKVQLHFQLTDLFVEFFLLGVGLLAYLLAAVAEDVGQAGQRLFLPPPTWVGWTPNICATWAAVLCALMASTATLAFRLGG
jgi:hypothetical protein